MTRTIKKICLILMSIIMLFSCDNSSEPEIDFSVPIHETLPVELVNVKAIEDRKGMFYSYFVINSVDELESTPQILPAFREYSKVIDFSKYTLIITSKPMVITTEADVEVRYSLYYYPDAYEVHGVGYELYIRTSCLEPEEPWDEVSEDNLFICQSGFTTDKIPTDTKIGVIF